jgi:2Fe-2S iron-sulfur cluster binding domain
MKAITLTVNGNRQTAAVDPRTHLADFLRETQGLTGTHLGCEHGICGACTLLLDGVPARSCITYAIACDGASVTTIEGLDDDEIAKELRQAFSREHALQCDQESSDARHRGDIRCGPQDNRTSGFWSCEDRGSVRCSAERSDNSKDAEASRHDRSGASQGVAQQAAWPLTR